jgi:hypothetical protein
VGQTGWVLTTHETALDDAELAGEVGLESGGGALPAIRLAPLSELAAAVRVAPGAAGLSDAAADDAALLEQWQGLLSAALDELVEQDEQDPDEIALGDVVIHALISDYSGDAHTLLGLAEEVVDDVDDSDVPPGPDLEAAQHELLELTLRRLRPALARLVALGAVQELTGSDDDPIALTPLGVAGLRQFALDEGLDAPLAPAVADLSAQEALEAIMAASARVADDLVAEWFGARPQVKGVAQLLDVARESSAAARYVVLTILDDVLEDGLGSLAPVVTHEVLLGPVLRAFIAEDQAISAVMAGPAMAGQGPGASIGAVLDRVADDPDALDALRQSLFGFGWMSGDFTPAERDLLIVETFARELDQHSQPVRTDDLERSLWDHVDDALVPQLALTGHPDVLLVLDALGSGHPAGRVRKAAKKAAHQHRAG